MINIKEATTKKEKKQFVTFPFSLYKNNKYWVPPIINAEVDSFDPTINPAFDTAEARFFLAYRGKDIVGRVAAIVNWDEINKQEVRKMRFGWFDMIDDIEVSKALINKVQEIGKSHNLEFIEGPVGFSNLDKVGVLTDGFDELGTMITWYNHPYYKDHLEQLGFKKEKGYLEYRFPFKNADPKFFSKAAGLIKKRYKLKAINFKSSKDIMPYVDSMFDLFNESYSKLSSFVAINEVQKKYFKEKYISFINPQFIKYVADENDNLVAFAVTMPSFSRALQKSKGKLFPFGFLHFLKAKKKNEDAIFYLIGVHPDYQNKGVTAILFDEYHKSFSAAGIKNCIRTPELEDNIAIQQLWKNFDPRIAKKRSTYRRNL